MGRKRAIRELDQQAIDQSFEAADILTNCRTYPKDEAPALVARIHAVEEEERHRACMIGEHAIRDARSVRPAETGSGLLGNAATTSVSGLIVFLEGTARPPVRT